VSCASENTSPTYSPVQFCSHSQCKRDLQLKASYVSLPPYSMRVRLRKHHRHTLRFSSVVTVNVKASWLLRMATSPAEDRVYIFSKVSSAVIFCTANVAANWLLRMCTSPAEGCLGKAVLRRLRVSGVCDTATHCNTLQHTATHCNTQQHTTIHQRCAPATTSV